MSKKRKVRQDTGKDLLYLAPLIFIIAVIPLIVFLKPVELKGIMFDSWTGDKVNYDFFSYYKAMFLITFTFITFLLILGRYFSGNFKFKKSIYYIPMAIYGLFVILSTQLAEYKDVASMGFVDRYEGGLVLLSYIIITFAAINLIDSEKGLKVLTGALIISAIVLGTIGLFQYLGFDLFRSTFGKHMILPSQFDNLADKLNFNFGSYTIYSTLYNTNFVGSYMAMLLPISVGLYIAIGDKYKKLGMGLFSCLMFANLIGSRSRAGMVGGIAAMVILLILFRKQLLKNAAYIGGLFVCFALIFIGLNAISNGSLGQKVSTLNPSTGKPAKSVAYADLKDIKLDGTKLTIVTSAGTVTASHESGVLNFFGTDGAPLAVAVADDGTISFQDDKYSALRFQYIKEQNVLKATVGGATASFFLDPNGIKIIGERGRLFDKITNAEKWGFQGNEKFGSSRGYIWSRTFPMLKQTILIGKGPDTYAIYFPQQDYVGKLRAFNKTEEIVDKPHNMYLQVGFNTGLVSLFALLALFGIYLVNSFITYLKNGINSLTAVIGAAAATAVTGYLVAALFNDSIVSVAPVFWILLGTGIWCNMRVSVKKEQDTKPNAPKGAKVAVAK